MPNITQIQVGTITYDIVDAITSLPIAASNTLGGVKIGNGISIANDGTISVSTQTGNNIIISVSSETMYFTF